MCSKVCNTVPVQICTRIRALRRVLLTDIAPTPLRMSEDQNARFLELVLDHELERTYHFGPRDRKIFCVQVSGEVLEAGAAPMEITIITNEKEKTLTIQDTVSKGTATAATAFR